MESNINNQASRLCILNNLLLIPGVEIELRVGLINNNLSFDSSIDKTYFEKINTSLLSYPEWELIEEIHTTDYVYSVDKNKKIRVSVDSNNNKKSIIKENIITKNISLKNSPFDVRFSVNQELNNSLNNQIIDKNNLTRQKARRTFKNKNFNYDLTNVIETKNNVKKEKFELEIELNINEETLEWSDEYIKDFLICKLNDLINIIEKSENINFENLQLI